MASKYLKKFPIPSGYQVVLHDLSLEILRNKPADIIEFAHEFFKAKDEGLDFNYEGKAAESKSKEKPKTVVSKLPQPKTTPSKEEIKPVVKEEKKEERKEEIKPLIKEVTQKEVVKTQKEEKELIKSEFSSSKGIEKEAQKYVNDIIEKVSQDDEEEEDEGEGEGEGEKEEPKHYYEPREHIPEITEKNHWMLFGLLR
mmetsp:Transcript_30036/g.26611  ORF Transcript_30036/g.26611 Transcript_30036/m.26611 type:complete len:198 (+) Transcript_30036:41-634(+)